MAGNGLEGDFQVTDILQTLYCNDLTGILFLVEIHRFHYAAVKKIHEPDSGCSEKNLNDDFNCFVHYVTFYLVS